MTERLRHRWRWTELSLLVLPSVFLALGLSLLDLVRPQMVGQAQLLEIVAVVALLLIAHAVLVWRHPGADQLLLPITAMLTFIGLVMAARLSILVPDLLSRQALWVALGLLLLMGTLIFLPDVSVLQAYKYTAAILGLLLVTTTFVLGVDPNGSGDRLWLGAAGLYFQPSEILKILLVVFLAGYLEDKQELLAWSSSRIGRLRLPPLPYLGPSSLCGPSQCCC